MLLCNSLIFLVLVEIRDVVDLEGSCIARVMPQKGTLGADNGVDLTHLLHDLQVVVVELGWHQIDVPHRKVGMEEDDSLHGQLGEVREVLQEAGQDDGIVRQSEFDILLRDTRHKL